MIFVLLLLQRRDAGDGRYGGLSGLGRDGSDPQETLTGPKIESQVRAERVSNIEMCQNRYLEITDVRFAPISDPKHLPWNIRVHHHSSRLHRKISRFRSESCGRSTSKRSRKLVLKLKLRPRMPRQMQLWVNPWYPIKTWTSIPQRSRWQIKSGIRP